MMNEQYRFCLKCNQIYLEDKTHFYFHKSGEPDCLCKECLNEGFDYDNENLVRSLCKRFDIPCLHYYINSVKSRFIKHEQKPAFGRYLAIFKLKGWLAWGYEDSECLEEAHKIMIDRRQKDLIDRKGIIQSDTE